MRRRGSHSQGVTISWKAQENSLGKACTPSPRLRADCQDCPIAICIGTDAACCVYMCVRACMFMCVHNSCCCHRGPEDETLACAPLCTHGAVLVSLLLPLHP